MLKAVSDVLGSEKVRAYCLDFGSRKESPEAKRIADWCNVKLVTKEMTPQDNIALTEEAVLRMRAPVDLSPVLFLSKLCKEDGTTKVISALGLDEIQGGYVPHVDSSSSDFPRIETDLLWRAQSYYVWLQMKQSEGCVEVKFPYLDAELIAFCRGLPRDQKCAGRETKVRIRKELRARKFIPAENIEAGRIAGTKAGFIPILKDWFDRGLADWTAANIPPQEVSLADRLVFRYLLIRGRTLEGKLQRRLRVATINAFNKLFDEGRFAR
jgi:asparagine synthetase B (glutamine-hydrolysing)